VVLRTPLHPSNAPQTVAQPPKSKQIRSTASANAPPPLPLPTLSILLAPPVAPFSKALPSHLLAAPILVSRQAISHARVNPQELFPVLSQSAHVNATLFNLVILLLSLHLQGQLTQFLKVIL
jgi:hypothetical protein